MTAHRCERGRACDRELEKRPHSVPSEAHDGLAEPLIFRKSPVQLALLGADALVFLASGIALYVVISRVAGASLLGQYSLVTAWMIVFQSIGNFGLPELLMRELGRFSDERGHYLGTGLMLGLSATVVVGPVMIGMSWLTSYDADLKRALTIAAFSLFERCQSHIPGESP